MFIRFEIFKSDRLLASNLNGPEDGLGGALVQTVIHSKTEAEFASVEMARLLNNGRTGDDAPWEFVKDAAYPTFKWLNGRGDDGDTTVPNDPGEDNPTDPITPIAPEDPIDDKPEAPVYDIDDGSSEEPPAVVVPIDPDRDVRIDTNTGVETVTVPELTQEIIDRAIEEANEAGTEPAVMIPVKKPVDPTTGEPVEVSEVHVEISVSDLITAADNEVNIRIDVFDGEGGEVTLNGDALKDLIERAD